MSFLRVCTAALLLAACAGSQLHAQKKASLPQKYAKWLNEEVVYIISDEERKDFLKLTSDDARDAYINEFWEIRNPLRGSERNPYREEHYKRIEYANETFGRETATPGWKTDMGRTYILFGKPQSRAPYKGYSQIYPLELWFYSNNSGNPSLPPFFYVLFFMPEDIGEYRYYHPIIDGPLKLVRGSQFNSNADVYRFLKPLGGDIARAPFSLVPSEPMDTENFAPSMSGEMLVNKIQEFANDSFQVKRIRELKYLRAKVNSWFLVAQQQPLELSSIVLADPAGNYWLDYALLIDDEKQGRKDPTGTQLLVTSGFRLLNESGEIIAEDAEDRAYAAFDKSSGQLQFRPFLVANRLPMIPGKYKLEVHVTNREAGRTFRGEKSIAVGPPGQVSMSEALLAASVQSAAKPDGETPFQYFGVQFVPAADRRFGSRHDLRALIQIHVPSQTARDYEIEYVLANTQIRTSRHTVTDKIPAAEFRNGYLLKAKTLPLADLEDGDYRAIINLRAAGSPEILASVNSAFKIGRQVAPPELYFLANMRNSSANGLAAYFRALEAMSQKDQGRAAEYLAAALDRMPGNGFASSTLVQIYFDGKNYKRVTELYDRLGITGLKTRAETLAQVALSYWQTGELEKANRVLEAAKVYFPKDTVLLAAAKRIGEPK
jgi:GWxTD domain-containing protein